MYITFQTDRKINLIKEVRTTHGLALKDAKDLVEMGCSTSDPEELAYLGRCLPQWDDATGGVIVTIKPGSGGVRLRREGGFTPATSMVPIGADLSVLRSDMSSLQMSHARMIEALEKQVAALTDHCAHLTNRVKALEDAPPKIIERVKQEEETMF